MGMVQRQQNGAFILTFIIICKSFQREMARNRHKQRSVNNR